MACSSSVIVYNYLFMSKIIATLQSWLSSCHYFTIYVNGKEISVISSNCTIYNVSAIKVHFSNNPYFTQCCVKTYKLGPTNSKQICDHYNKILMATVNYNSFRTVMLTATKYSSKHKD